MRENAAKEAAAREKERHQRDVWQSRTEHDKSLHSIVGGGSELDNEAEGDTERLIPSAKLSVADS